MPSYVLGLSLVRCNGIILMRTLKMNNRFITHGCSSFEKLLGDKYCFLTTSCSNNKQTSIGMYSRNLARGRGSCQFSSLSVINAIAISSPVITMQNVLLYMDSVGHLPWWATIVLATLGIRVLITFPFMIYQHHILAKYLNLQPEIKHLVEQLKIETAAAVRLYKWDEKKAKFEFKKSVMPKHIY